ncbi:uncharacterized protein LOC127262387 [Andrographis paniculata]|uniref:uncharacterized protein LOC127262387 n=1 Tax=Andrographis paniculata TaxID=175694 RepID=UPI0021E73034|nr:uncharacterized protein LOC127262387 [Andrographis paniculata]
MSLVDYAASSDEGEPNIPSDDDEEEEKQQKEQVEESPGKRRRFGGSSSPNPPKGDARMPKNLQPQPSRQVEAVSELKLPDASFLLNSPTVSSNLLMASDHSSRVAAAMAENATRKRESNISPATYPRRKVPRGNLPHSKNVPDTIDGRLLPPQLAGRSNIVTEDISKLFVRRSSKSSDEGPVTH